jgi:hypothetical protein
MSAQPPMEYRAHFAFTLALLLTACEAHTTVQTRFVLPSAWAISETSIGQLHVALLSSEDFSRKLSLPTGKCPTYEAGGRPDEPGVALIDGKLTLEQSRIPSVPEFCVAAWFDRNGNGRMDRGDAVGQLDEPYPAQPSTFFGSNNYESPPVVLGMEK